MNTNQSKLLRVIAQLAIGVSIVGVYFYLSYAEEPAIPLHGTFVDKSVQLERYQLTDHDNKPISLDAFKGRWLVLFFGYTHCPDVCPTTLAYLTREYAELRELRKYAQVVMVSVDPKRDSPDSLKAYVQGFNPDFIGTTGEEANLEKMVKNFGGFFHYHEADSAVQYTVEHPGDIFLVSPEGRWHSVYRPPLENGILSEDLRALILKFNT